MAKKRHIARTRDAEGSKAKILAAARQHFADKGYERTTVRAIAEAASVDPALVIRYFGSKEQLLSAAADFDLRLPDLTGVPPERIAPALVEHFVARWEADDTFVALLRSAVTHPLAAKRMRDVLRKQVAPAVAAAACGGDGSELRAGLVASQILGLALCRYVLRVSAVAELGPSELSRLVAPTLERYVRGDLG